MLQKIKEYLNEETIKMNYKDFLTLFIIVTIYSIISFYNLGSTTNPNTFASFEKTESLIIELYNQENIIKLKAFNGYNNATYQIYISDDNIKYNYVTKITGEGSFAWDEARILTKGKYLKLLFTEDSTLGEIALYNNKKEQIKLRKITYKKSSITKLTDEKSTIPNQISYYNSTYFDEIYFARTAFEYTKGLETYEWTHPPLGKLIQALPIYITKKMTPFNYRLMGNLAGIFMLIIIYNFGKLLFKKRRYAILPAILLALDTFHFTQTRIGTVDSHLVLFIMLATYYMLKFTTNSKTRYLFLSGLFFTLSISVKWTGLYSGIALAIIYFNYLFTNKSFNIKYIIKGTIFFVIVPITFYISMYLLFPNNRINYTNSIEKTIIHQKDMFNYHSNLESNHYFSSPWYTWPISYKPVWYHNQVINQNTRETISVIGNIFIWYLGIISIIYLFYKLLRSKDKNAFKILVIILSLWLPYAFIGRVMFIYHYFPVTPFLILAITLFLKKITEKYKVSYIIPIYLILVATFFIVYYPISSGHAVSNNYIDNLRLFKSWYF